jgi:thiol-disulfide isomerase/thioredoxin
MVQTVKVHYVGMTILVLSILLAPIWGCSGDGGGSPQTEREDQAQRKQYAEIREGKAPMAADFELPRLEGGTFRLSDYYGQIILLDFWATYCPPCRMSIPHLIKVYEQYKDRNVLVVGVALDGDGAGVVEKFVDTYKIPYPILLGNPEVVALYGNFQAIPISFLINQKGEIVERHSGFRPRQVYETSIEFMLKEEANPEL